MSSNQSVESANTQQNDNTSSFYPQLPTSDDGITPTTTTTTTTTTTPTSAPAPAPAPPQHKYSDISQDSKGVYQLSVSSVNYCGDKGSENIFQFYSSDLDASEEYLRGCEMFTTMTYSALKALVTNDNLRSILGHIVLSDADANISIVSLVNDEKIHWGADNKTPNRPNAILTSSIRRKAPSQEELNRWYTTEIQKYTSDIESEASTYTEGNANLVISGLLVYDLLCNHVYESCNLNLVRSQRARLTDEDELDYQISKFNNVINPLLSSDIVAVQESIDFSILRKFWFWCFKSNVLPKNKVIINGVENSDISLIVDSSLARNINLLTSPETTMSKYLKKTSFFSVNDKGSNVLLCVPHMKNPKGEALNVAKELKRMIQVLKSQSSYDYVIVIGDTNIEAKNEITPAQFATELGMTKVANSQYTTSKKRTYLQGQVEKANTEAQEEKDMCFHSHNLTCKSFQLLPEEVIATEYTSGNIYPSITKSYYPRQDWQSDHRAISVTFEGSFEVVF